MFPVRVVLDDLRAMRPLGGLVAQFLPPRRRDHGGEYDASAFDADTVTGLLKFRGDVRFAAHHGLLFLRIADPWLSVIGGAGTLTIAAPPGQSPERIPLTTLRLRTADPTDHTGFCLGTHVRLTAQGSELFNGVYPVDEPFDDLTLLLTPSSTTALEKTP
ncbi:HtaA domain-containing protein [Streptomyces sp. UG1]|uniref:HtaA domain-containing protein n=1 Tax=Streptomyces sp. UG1 TaxID=3417652 RepID=UPI003CFAAD64